MFKSLFSYFWGDKTLDISVDEAYLVLEKSNEDEKQEQEDKCEEISQDFSVFHRTGTITSAKKNKYVIDKTYQFENDMNLIVGMKVSFVAYIVDDKVNISNITVCDNDWDLAREKTRSWCDRGLITKVVKRENRKINVSPGELTIDLNKVSSEFNPILGDWLDLQLKVEVDENVADLFGKILEVSLVRPVRPRVVQGIVKKWDQLKGQGVIDNKVFFTTESLIGGYIPVINDKVITEAIESEQGMYMWRSLKVIPQIGPKSAGELFHRPIDYEPEVTGVSISDDIYLNVLKVNEMVNFTFEIKNTSGKNLNLLQVYFSNNSSCFKVNTILNPSGLEIKRNGTVKIECECFVKGSMSNLILFVFENDKKIERHVTINCQNNVEKYDRAKHIHGENLFIQARQFNNKKSRDVIPGQKVVQTPRFISARLSEYGIPEKLMNIILKHNTFNENAELNQALLIAKPCLTVPLSFHIYEDKFHTLLHLEEIHNLIAIRTYDQDATCFIRNGEYMMLEIDNLSERRPSIIIGDRVLIKDSYKTDGVSYEGYVHKVGAKHIYIKFAPMFHDNYAGEDYSVKIVASRTQFRRLHQAVGLVVRNLGPTVLFPSKVSTKPPQVKFTYDKYDDIIHTTDKKLKNRSNDNENVVLKQTSQLLLNNEENEGDKKTRNDRKTFLKLNNQHFKLEWYDKSLNYYQKEAVRNVLLGESRPLPYIIFGPPGTGKTVTLIEIILQILRMIPHSRLLVAAPSNSAADLVASRLIDSGVLKPGDLVRLVAYRCVAENTIPPKLVPYSATIDIAKEGSRECPINTTLDGVVLGCNSAVIGRHRVTVGTCSSLGGLFSLGFSRGHFTHIIIDEAGQASEPDVMIPLAFLDVHTGQAILAGDHMQLGPVILSNIAVAHGMGESYLERLIHRFPYVRDLVGFPESNGYDPRLVTKLIYNYRSLPELLTLPNQLFYSGELKPTISDEDSEEAVLLQSLKELLPRRTNGGLSSLVFHGVLGENYQTPDSPSWFNPNEASQVFYYMNEFCRLGVSAENIGIITPYVKQVKQIRALLDEAEFELPKIGTVEEFQGREFNIILLSLVRSSESLISNDLKYGIGFLANPKRMNVALTRAQTLTIVIGNPYTVARDYHWRIVIQHCISNGSYTGCELNFDLLNEK